MVERSLVGLCFLAGLYAPAARADFTFGTPVDIQSAFALLNPATEWIDCFSADGLGVYIESQLPGGYGLMDLWVLKRASVEDDRHPPENLGPLVNGARWDKNAFISADGLELYFHSSCAGGYGGVTDLYVTRCVTRTSPWGDPVNLGPAVNGPFWQKCRLPLAGWAFAFVPRLSAGWIWWQQ